jgi:DNA-binding MarR family transcriptional regulator
VITAIAILALLTVLAALATKRGRAREQQFLTHLAAHPYSRGPELCQALGWSRVSLHSMIERLIDEGRIVPYWSDGPDTRRGYCVAVTPAAKEQQR